MKALVTIEAPEGTTVEAIKQWAESNPFSATVEVTEGFAVPANDESAPADPAVGETVADTNTAAEPKPEAEADAQAA